MRTPEEIKKGLECCAGAEKCIGCTYATDEDYELNCLNNIMLDALAYIQQLESSVEKANSANVKALRGLEKMQKKLEEDNKTIEFAHNRALELTIERNDLKSRLAQVERERDAAVDVMAEAAKEGAVCTGCKHSTGLDDACEAADFDCNDCKVPCMCRTCEANSNYEWRGITT